MKESELQRLIRLARKTGDTLVVADPTGNQSIVLMPIDRYEAMVDMQEVIDESLLDEVFEDDFEASPDSADSFEDYEGGVGSFEEEGIDAGNEDQIVPPGLPIDTAEDESLPPATRIEPIGQSEPVPMVEEFDTEEERFYLEPVE